MNVVGIATEEQAAVGGNSQPKNNFIKNVAHDKIGIRNAC